MSHNIYQSTYRYCKCVCVLLNKFTKKRLKYYLKQVYSTFFEGPNKQTDHCRIGFMALNLEELCVKAERYSEQRLVTRKTHKCLR